MTPELPSLLDPARRPSRRGAPRAVDAAPQPALAALPPTRLPTQPVPVGRHLVLLGAMASGKTTVGQAIATCLDRPFLDSDREIEDLFRLTSADVEAAAGVAVLHAIEAEVLRRHLGSERPAVIAAAASVVDDERSRRLLHERGYCVWLYADPAIVAARVAAGPRRPRLGGGSAARIEHEVLASIQARAIATAQLAARMIDVSHLSVDATIDRILTPPVLDLR